MKKLLLFIIVSLAYTFLSCSSPTEIDEAITTLTTNNSIIINSSFNNTLYLFVVEQGIAARINWTTGFDDPKVSANGSISISYEDIYNGSSESVKTGDKIILNYWDRSNEANPKVYSKVVEL